MKIDEHEQYSRREALRNAGLVPPQSDDYEELSTEGTSATENTDDMVLTFCNQVLALSPPLDISDIDRSHRSGDPSAGNVRPVSLGTVSGTESFAPERSSRLTTRTILTPYTSTRISRSSGLNWLIEPGSSRNKSWFPILGPWMVLSELKTTQTISMSSIQSRISTNT